jgi:hypothetical protein
MVGPVEELEGELIILSELLTTPTRASACSATSTGC